MLKEILGHEQLNTTQIYTHVADSDVELAMAKNPLAGDVKRVSDRTDEQKDEGNDKQ